MSAPLLALGLAGPHLIELTGDRALRERWDALPLAFTVLGLDRIDGSAPAPLTLDSSAVGASLAGRTTRGRFLIVATPQRDHPFNLARRVATLGHLSAGRSGVLVGVRDAYAPPGPESAPAWGGAGLGVGAPLNAATAWDAASAVRALEQSWPYKSIVGDRESGIFVRSDEIGYADVDNAFQIAGPLNTPTPRTGPSVIAWYATSPGDGAEVAADAVAADGSPVDVRLDRWSVPGRLVLAGAGVAGEVYAPPADQGLAAVLDEAEARLASAEFAPAPLGQPLRAALGLALPPRPAGRRAAFPAPQPHPEL